MLVRNRESGTSVVPSGRNISSLRKRQINRLRTATQIRLLQDMNSLSCGREKMYRGWKLAMLIDISSLLLLGVATTIASLSEDELEIVVLVSRLSNNPASANNDKSTTYFPIAVQHRGVAGDIVQHK